MRKGLAAFKDLADQNNLLLLGSVVVLGLIGLFGGWNRVAEKKTVLQSAAAKQEFTASPLKLEFLRGFWFKDKPELMPLQPLSANERGLLVTVDVTNTSPRPVSMVEVQAAFRTTAAGLTELAKAIPAAEARPTLLRTSDLRPVRSLQPGLKTRVALIWIQGAAQPVPPNLKVVVYRQTYRKSALDGSMGYFDRTAAAQVDLPLTQFQVPK